MELIMFLGNDFIESIQLNTEKISQPGYLGSFKRQLQKKYESLIQETGERPEFLIANLSPAAASPVQYASAYEPAGATQMQAVW